MTNELYVFKSKKAVWQQHSNKEGTANCFGRIMRLYYPWKWDTIYCMRECCKSTDRETLMEAGIYHPDEGTFTRHIAGTVVHYDPVFIGERGEKALFWCMDCGRVGYHEEES